MDNIIEEDDIKSLIGFLNVSDRFTNGPKVKEFEEKWSRWLNVDHSVMVNSGASGNFLSIALVKELYGVGEVIVPSLGWSSDVSSVVQLGMTPVFVDVDPQTMGILPSSLEKALSPETKAVVVVHALGFNALSGEVKKILDNANVFVIEDCCEAHGAVIDADLGNRVGTYGDLSVFSFYFGHHMTTIEGGIVSTNNEKLFQLSRMLRSHGMTREASQTVRSDYEKRYPDLNPLFTFALAGFNFRSTELNAVIGISQLKKLDQNILTRQENLGLWLDSLSAEKFKVNYQIEGNSSFALPLILNEEDPSLKTKVCEKLKALDIEYRLGTAGGGNLSRQPFLQNYKHRIVDDQIFVNHIHDFGLYVGNGCHVKKKSIKLLTDALNAL